LECDAIYSSESELVFWGNVSPPSLGLKIKVSSDCSVLYAGFLLGLFFDPEDGGGMFFWIV
jgi:hypothetical protein